MQQAEITRRIRFNTLVQYGGKIVSVLLGLLSLVILTRYLGTKGYGDYALIFAYVTLFGVIADFGLHATFIREYVQRPSLHKQLIGTFFWVKIFFVFLSFFLCVVILPFFPYSVMIKTGIIIAAFANAISCLNGYGLAILESKVRLDLVMYVDLFIKCITVGVISLFVFLHMQFYLLLLAIVIGNTSGFILTTYITSSHRSYLFSYSLAKKLFLTSLPIGLTAMFSLLYFKIDMILLSVLKGAIDVGIYTLSYRVLEHLLIFWGLYMANIYPLLSQHIYTNKNITRTLIQQAFVFALCLSVVMGMFCYLFAPVIITALGGETFLVATDSLRILVFALPFLFINAIFYQLFLVKRNIPIIMTCMILVLISNIIANTIFIPQYGYLASSYITVISEIMLSVGYGACMVFFVKKDSNSINKGISTTNEKLLDL